MMAWKRDSELTLTRGSEEFEILARYTVHNWGCPAQTYGPSENCFPAEGVELELDDAVVSAPPWAVGKYPYNLIPFVIWFTVENNVVIAAASIPTIKPLFSRKRAGYAYGSYSLSGSSNRNGHGDRSGIGGCNPKRLHSLDHSQSQSHAEVTTDDRRFGGGMGIKKETTLTQTFVDEEGDRHSRDDSEAELAGGIARAV